MHCGTGDLWLWQLDLHKWTSVGMFCQTTTKENSILVVPWRTSYQMHNLTISLHHTTCWLVLLGLCVWWYLFTALMCSDGGHLHVTVSSRKCYYSSPCRTEHTNLHGVCLQSGSTLAKNIVPKTHLVSNCQMDWSDWPASSRLKQSVNDPGSPLLLSSMVSHGKSYIYSSHLGHKIAIAQ